MQHPSELNAAKGTVRLLQLVLPQTTVYIGECENDFSELRDRALQHPNDWALLYPRDNSVNIDSRSDNPPKNLIAIDGTWKKAYRLLQMNRWLSAISAVTFPKESQSRYRIRKAPIDNSFSTLESVAMALQTLEGLSSARFLEALEARMRAFEVHKV